MASTLEGDGEEEKNVPQFPAYPPSPPLEKEGWRTAAQVEREHRAWRRHQGAMSLPPENPPPLVMGLPNILMTKEQEDTFMKAFNYTQLKCVFCETVIRDEVGEKKEFPRIGAIICRQCTCGNQMESPSPSSEDELEVEDVDSPPP